MIATPANNSPGAQAAAGKPQVGIIGNEGGFILAFVLFMLAICIILGTAAMQTTVDETDIAANEVIAKRTFTLAESALPLAAIPVLTTQGKGTWETGTLADPTPVYLDDKDPMQTDSSGVIQIVDGKFLTEGPDQDGTYGTGWNNMDKYIAGPDTAHKAAYKPIDDPFGGKKADGTAYDSSVSILPDIRIRAEKQLVIDVDVDKANVAYLAGGVAEFGSGAEGSGGTAYKLVYLFDAKATLPGKDILNSRSPVAEAVMGYRFIPDSGI